MTAVALTSLGLAACRRAEPAGYAGDGAVAPLPAAQPAATNMRGADAGAAAGASFDAATEASPPPSPTTRPADVDAGQTTERPTTTSVTFAARASVLVEAIARNDPSLAHDAFFPLAAYEQVKDVANPRADYRRRLLAAFDRDIRDLHVKLGERAAGARLVALEVPEARAKWIDPGEEYNKVGYFRVYGSKLKISVDGREQSFPVKSLISWRGEWYVVHLSGFK